MENIRTIVCKNFNRLVEDSPLTKKEIARQMHIDPSTLQRWKNGDTFPEIGNIEKLSSILGVDPREFYIDDAPIIKREKVSSLLEKMLSIPDDIYNMAGDLGSDKEGWDMVRVAMKNRIGNIQKAEKKKNQA